MPRPPNPDLKRRLIEAARALLVEDGHHGLSLRKLARRVGCSQTAVYVHFDNRDGLIHALIDEGMRRLHEALVAAGGPVRDPARRIERMCRAYMEFGSAHPEFYEVMFTLPPEQMQRYPPDMYRRAVRNLELFQEALAEAWGRRGARARDLRLAATSIWATLHGTLCLMRSQRVDFALPADALVRSSVRLASSLAQAPRGRR